MIQIGPHPNGVVLSVRAQPRAREDRLIGEYAGALKVSVTEPPEHGKANQAIIKMLAGQFGIAKALVRLLSGATSRDKRFLLIDQQPGEIQEKLERLTAKAKS